MTLPLAAGVLYKHGYIVLSSAAGAVLMTASTVDDVINVSIVKSGKLNNYYDGRIT